MASPQRQVGDRRTSPRYPVNLPLQFQAVLANGGSVSGSARTVNLSNFGVLFEGGEALLPGLHVQVKVEWPSRPGSALSVQLHGTGVTLDRRGNATALVLERYQFRAALNPNTMQTTESPATFGRPVSKKE
jgi:hypothetical protein